MSHTVYNTDAIVLSRVDTGEADITLWLLTKDLGLVVARAQGARKELAKMRGQLQSFNVLSASLVKGRHLWRLTGAEGVTNEGNSLSGDALQAFARIAAFVRRMTVADSGVDLFSLILNIRESLSVDIKEALDKVELLAIAKILTKLGYMDENILIKDRVSKRTLVADINKAINESHL